MGPYDCGFSTFVQIDLISKSFKSDIKSFINYELLSKATLQYHK